MPQRAASVLGRAAGQRGDMLVLIDDIQPADAGRGIMTGIVQTKNRQLERGGLLPDTALQAITSVAARLRLFAAERQCR